MNIILDNINQFYFDNETQVSNRYFKQKLAMSLYNRMNIATAGIHTSLKEIWAQINLFFYLLSNPNHTANPSHEYFMSVEYSKNQNFGD